MAEDIQRGDLAELDDPGFYGESEGEATPGDDSYVPPGDADYDSIGAEEDGPGSGFDLELTPLEPKSTMEMLLEHFPFPEIRPVQVSGLEVVAKTYDSKKQTTILELPTGAGKTLISMAVGGFARQIVAQSGEKGVPGAHILTAQNNLLSQMITEFGDKGLVQIRGKANYRCKEHGSDCGTGSLMNKGKTCTDCPYRDDKNRFISSPLGVTNYTYYLTENRHVGEIAKPHYLVLDEAHNLEDEILGMVHIDITDRRADDLNISLPKFDANAQGDIRYWLNETFIPAAEKRDDLLRAQVARFQDETKNAPTGSREKDTADRNAKLSAKEQQSLANLVNNVGNYLADSNSTGWFAWTGDKGQLTIRPLSAANYAQDLLFSHAPHVLMMSATILDFNTFERNLGISKAGTDTFAAPSDFATSNRRIVYWPSGNMNFREAEASIPNIARRSELLLSKHEGHKGVIHSHSYRVNGYLEDYFSRTKHRNRIITHTNKPGAREEAIAKHIASEDPTILLSPSMTEGLDLKDDLSRLQIVTKIPFPALDAYTRFRMERDPAWYAWKTALALVQATGRSIRSRDDWAITVILDSAFERFLIQNQDILPEWWKAAIEFK